MTAVATADPPAPTPVAEPEALTAAGGYKPQPYKRDADETVKCPNCAKYDDTDAKFCDQCGHKLAGALAYKAKPDEDVICPKCDLHDDLDAVFCDQCGFKLAGATGVKVAGKMAAAPETFADDADPEPVTETASVTAAAVTDEAGLDLPDRWHAILAPEGVLTGDGRMLAPGAIGARPLPLPFMFLDETGKGHDGAAMCGQITVVERRDNYVYAEGTYDLGGAVGREAARCCRDQLVRFVSVDLTDMETEWVPTGGGDMSGDDDIISILFGGDDDGYTLVTKANIGAATQCTIPAFYQAVVAPIDVELDMSGIPAVPTGGPLGMVAAGHLSAVVDVPDFPPAEWFTDPQLDGPTHVTVTDEGRVYGHIALWNQKHIGMAGQVYPPHSSPGYPFYQTGTTRCTGADGQMVDVKTGPLTMGTGHDNNDKHLLHEALAHYDNTGTIVATWAVGEDEHGIWASGALIPGATKHQVRVLRATDVSGDWRKPKLGYPGYEMCAVLNVNVAGFPVSAIAASAFPMFDGLVAWDSGNPRAGFVGDEQVSLVAAGVVKRDRTREALLTLAKQLVAMRDEFRADVAAMRAELTPLRSVAAERALARIGAGR